MKVVAALVLFVVSLTSMASQTLSEPTEADLQILEARRATVVQHLKEDDRSKYLTAAGKLGTLRAILAARIHGPQATYELQSLGIVFGDVVVQEMGFRWIVVEDAYGRDPAIQFRDTSIIAFPLTMLSKRIERGEEVDVFALYNGLAAKLAQLIENETGQ